MLHPDLKSRDSISARAPEEALAEAVALGVALPGLEIIGDEVVPLPKMRAGTLFGTGKIEELKHRFHDNEVELVLIDGPVTPVQQRNLEKEWKVKILDRTGLILEIFSDRAATREGVLQVELAALSYQRTRLVRAWTHLERQRGGLGFVGGPGETQIEADRRAIDERINKIKTQLAKTVKTRELHRAARAKVPFPIVALVGYTNAGKSTLFNRLTGADVMVKDMLFATLDPTMRSVELPDGVEIIMSDTVGFISDLPTQLVAAFRATLEEVLSADLILHVRDISHPETDAQAEDVRRILSDLGVDTEITTLDVWNKLDKLDAADLEARNNTAARDEAIYVTSALTGVGMGPLLEAISREVTEATVTDVLRFGFDAGRKRAWLFEQDVVDKEDADEAGFVLSVTWSATQKARFEKEFGGA